MSARENGDIHHVHGSTAREATAHLEATLTNFYGGDITNIDLWITGPTVKSNLINTVYFVVDKFKAGEHYVDDADIGQYRMPLAHVDWLKRVYEKRGFAVSIFKHDHHKHGESMFVSISWGGNPGLRFPEPADRLFKEALVLCHH
jgi:hypothetical protein